MCITGEAGGFWNHFGVEKKKEKETGSNVWSTEEKVNERRRDIIAISASES